MTALIVALLLTGAGLLVAEAHVVSYGLLGTAGIAALVAAAVLTVGAAGGGLVAALAVALPIAAALGALAVVATHKSLAVRRRRPLGGADGLVGRVGVVRHAFTPEGDVFVAGELWHARPCLNEDDEAELAEGEQVVVERVQGLTLGRPPCRGVGAAVRDEPSLAVSRVDSRRARGRPRSPPRSGSCASTSARWCSGSGGWSRRKGPGLVLLIPGSTGWCAWTCAR